MRTPAFISQLIVVFLCLSAFHPLRAQVCLHEDELSPPVSLLGAGMDTFETRHGRYLPPHGILRVLVVLVEVDYQTPGEPDPTGPNGYPGWPAHQLPVWVDNVDPTENLFDSEVLPTPQGSVTRYYHQASSGSLNVIADYLLTPTGSAVFSVPSSTGYFQTLTPVITAVDNILNGSFNTYLQHGVSDFDNFTINGTATQGLQKNHPSTEIPARFDHLCVILRNCRNRAYLRGENGQIVYDQNGQIVYIYPEMDQTGSTNHGTQGSIFGHDSNTWSRFAAYNKRPTSIFRHEFGHNLYGGNSFHYAGGGDGTSGMYWISYSGGWGNMGLHNCSIESWSAWDRLQMGWKNAGQVNQIAARNASNTNEVNGELDATVPTQAGTYILRDFVQTGDALHIKLPFLPGDKYPEYIWVENHQGRTLNGNQFDKFKFESDDPTSCITQVVPGLYMYMQIDREKRTDLVSGSNLYGGYEEFARPLSANGAWDEQWVTDPNTDWCVGPPPGMAFQRNAPNPLTGSGDTYQARYDTNADGTLAGNENRLHTSEYDAGTNTYAKHLYTNSHSR